MKIRINELARELEVKPQRILELLPELGVDEKKTHSSSVDDDTVVKIREFLAKPGNRESTPVQTRIAELDEPIHAAPSAAEVERQPSKPAEEAPAPSRPPTLPPVESAPVAEGTKPDATPAASVPVSGGPL